MLIPIISLCLLLYTMIERNTYSSTVCVALDWSLSIVCVALHLYFVCVALGPVPVWEASNISFI